MARKKIEPIESLGKDVDKLTVQKSQPLFSLWRSDLTLAEFKILDTYLARIDSHNPDKRAVIFEKGELENLLGIKKINTADLKDRLKHLMSNVIELPDGTSKKGVRLITLFEEAVAVQDNYGLWKVRIECTQKAMKYIFNIENLGYLRYKLRCITSLKSRQAYVLFIFLESNRFRTPFEVDLQELKEILCCDKEETYKEYKRFNDRVLKRIQKELNEKTECKFSYESVKKGRSVVAIRFHIETLPKDKLEDIDPNQITLEDYEKTLNKELWETALVRDGELCEFTEEQLEEIRQVLVTVPIIKLPEDTTTYMDNIDFRRYHYIAQKYATLNRKHAEQPIKHRFSYFLKMLKKDAGILD